ncbi:MAG: hypothetical protein M5U25_00365 [Planctomycetota bacterium]|nr:hypothetical protein [Planctomycetota bacterium]
MGKPAEVTPAGDLTGSQRARELDTPRAREKAGTTGKPQFLPPAARRLQAGTEVGVRFFDSFDVLTIFLSFLSLFFTWRIVWVSPMGRKELRKQTICQILVE